MRVFHRLVASVVLTGQALVAAFQFLSRIPLPMTVPFNAQVSRRSLLFYPFVGWVLGWFLLVILWGLSSLFPPFVTAVLVLFGWTAFSGALHLDGWMDTADGLLSHQSKEKILDIMRDSRVGAMGAIAAVFALLIKAALLTSILTEGILDFSFYIVMIPALSRLSMVYAIVCYPYVRKQGSGSMYSQATTVHVIGATFVSLCCTVLTLMIVASSVNAAFLSYIVILFVAAILTTIVISAGMTRKIAGMTGDTYGFLNEAVEITLLLIAWILGSIL